MHVYNVTAGTNGSTSCSTVEGNLHREEGKMEVRVHVYEERSVDGEGESCSVPCTTGSTAQMGEGNLDDPVWENANATYMDTTDEGEEEDSPVPCTTGSTTHMGAVTALFEEPVHKLREALNRIDECTEHGHYTHKLSINTPKPYHELTGQPLPCATENSNSKSSLRILRAAATHFPLLRRLVVLLYEAIRLHRLLDNIDTRLCAGDFKKSLCKSVTLRTIKLSFPQAPLVLMLLALML